MRAIVLGLAGIALLIGLTATAQERPEARTYSQNEILREIEQAFGEGAEQIADVVARAFEDNGEPNAYIAGNEAAAALGLGIRYGKGELQTRSGETREVYWQGPSVGFDAGADVTKVFVLVYDLERSEDLFQRFPGVGGSLYFVGGVGMNYLRANGITIAPIRLGAGWRQGVNIGYMDFTREASVIPF